MSGMELSTLLSGSPEKCGKQPKYVKPRIGSQFQVDILPHVSQIDNNTTTSSSETETSRSEKTSPVVRPAPPLKKRGRPPKNKNYVSRINSSESLTKMNSGSAYQNLSLPINPLSSLQTNIPSRGGLCVHRSKNTTLESSTNNIDYSKMQNILSYEQYLVFARNLMLQMPRKSSHSDMRADYLWKEALATKRFGEPIDVSTNTTTGSRRGLKRKVEIPDDDDMAWGMMAKPKLGKQPQSLPDQKDNSEILSKEVPSKSPKQMPRNTLIGLENDEQMLEYLQVKHNGNVNRAQLVTLSELSMGHSYKARKYLLRKKKEEDENGAPLAAMFSPFSVSWRRRYEMISSNMYGDMRRKPSIAKYLYYNIDKNSDGSNGLFPWMRNSQQLEKISDSVKGNLKSTGHRDVKLQSTVSHSDTIEENEILVQTWRTLLEHGQTLLRKIKSKESPPPSLDDVLVLLGKAYASTQPEDVFLKRDSTPKHISHCLNSLLEHVESARNMLSQLIDLIYDSDDNGIELDVLKKKVDAFRKNSCLFLHELDTVNKILKESFRWESKLNGVGNDGDSDASSMSVDLNHPQESLIAVEKLAREAQSLVLRPRSLRLLEKRIERASNLRDRIRKWKKDSNDQSENVKYISSMIKEANKISLNFPELSILSKLHRNAEEWIDRATIAIRSKISLNELEELLEKGEKMPVDLSNLLDKLRSKMKTAIEWINKLKIEVPCPENENSKGRSDVQPPYRSQWFESIRNTFNDGTDDQISALIELSSSGARIPVGMEYLHLLQSAIEFRNWSLKAKRWVPDSSGEPLRRGKIEDIQDHLKVANLIRNKIRTDSNDKLYHWKLDHEENLKKILKQASEWNEKYREYLQGDNRKTQGRCRVSFSTLQKIVQEAELIPANLGNPLIKMNRILSQANTWVEENHGILGKCGIKVTCTTLSKNILSAKSTKFSMEEVSAAVENANKNLSIDLEEVQELQDVATRAQSWYDRALLFAPKRSKRNVRGKKITQKKHELDEIVSLIDEATSLPVDTKEDLERLKMQLSEIQSWRIQAHCDLKNILEAFILLKAERIKFYGSPSEFNEIIPSLRIGTDDSVSLNQSSSTIDEKEGKGSTRQDITLESSNRNPPMKIPGGGKTVYKMITNFLKASKGMAFYTVEEQVAEMLDNFGIWCKKAAIVIASPNDIFTDKKWINELEEMVDNGGKMVQQCLTIEGIDRDQFDDKSLLNDLFKVVSSIISDDVTRLNVLCCRRDEFYAWCKRVDEILSATDKKISLEALKELNKESSIYPSSAETVKQLHKELQAASAWSKSANALIKSGDKILIDDAKNLASDGENLNVICHEFKIIKNALRVAKGWQKRVISRCSDQASTQISEIRALIDEHETFMISMPNELANLKQTMCGYCICRRPYDGFMIGCDECDEWYHGQCIGITESQAERYDKFVCVRCSIKQLFEKTSRSVGKLIRKWSDDKEIVKARLQDSQKHNKNLTRYQREKAKIEKDIEDYMKRLSACNKGEDNKTQISSPIDANNFNQNDTSLNDHCLDPAQLKSCQSPNSDLSESANKKEKCSSNEETNITEAKSIQNKLERAKASLKNCTRRLDGLQLGLEERRNTESKEDSMVPYLRHWFLLVRTSVIVPESDTDVLKSYPTGNDSMSAPMVLMVEKATKFGINHFADVSSMINCFKCLSWCLKALSVLRRKPKLREVDSLLSLSNHIKFLEEKGVRMLRSMVQRATMWQNKVSKTLMSIPGETKTFDLDALNQHRLQLKDIPMTMPEEHLLVNTIEDGGVRYCLCGGPNDGSFMLSCDKCDKWFHGICVHLDKETGDKLSKWICPLCEKSNDTTKFMETVKTVVEERKQGRWRFLDDITDVKVEDVSPNAPDPKMLWPPFGMTDSQEVAKVFGDTLRIRPGDVILPPLSNSHTNISSTNKLPITKRFIRLSKIENESETGLEPPDQCTDFTPPVLEAHESVLNESKGKDNYCTSIPNKVHIDGREFPKAPSSLVSTGAPPLVQLQNHSTGSPNAFPQNQMPSYPRIVDSASTYNTESKIIYSQNSSGANQMHGLPHAPLKRSNSRSPMTVHQSMNYPPVLSSNIPPQQHKHFHTKPVNSQALGTSNSLYPMSSPHVQFQYNQHNMVRVNQSRLSPLNNNAEHKSTTYNPNITQNKPLHSDSNSYSYSQSNMGFSQNGGSGNKNHHIDLKFQGTMNNRNLSNTIPHKPNAQNSTNYTVNQSNSFPKMDNVRHTGAPNRQQHNISIPNGDTSFCSSRNLSSNISIHQPLLDVNRNNLTNNTSLPHQNEPYGQRQSIPAQTNRDIKITQSNQNDTSPNQSSLANLNLKHSITSSRSPLPVKTLPQAGYPGGPNTLHYVSNGVYNTNHGKPGDNGEIHYGLVQNGGPYQPMRADNISVVKNTTPSSSTLDVKKEIPQDESR